mmetsp:Transcript_856/g.2043  ORF Transcript_856/g.2043 Transcript_856/m.2043 type:complete len:1337 (-) Transcript_856:35-4045(-)
MYKFNLAEGQTIEYPKSEVKKVAQRIGLDLQHDAEKYEWFLKHALASLLPTEWRKEKDPTGMTQFHNTKTQITTQIHPLTYKFRSAFMRLVKREAIREQPDITDVNLKELLKREKIKSRRLGANVDINILSVEEQVKAFEELLHKKSSYTVANPDKENHVIYEVDEYYQLMLEGWDNSPPDYILYSTDYLQADPMAVYAASKLLGIRDYGYLWAARLMISLPLPPLWKKIKDPHGSVMYVNTEHDISMPHHPSVNTMREFLKKIEQLGNTNEAVLEFYDKKFNKQTVDSLALFRGVLKVLRVSQHPDIDILNRVRQKNAKISVEDSLNDVMALELARISGIDLRTETHMLNYMFMFLDSMREQQLFKGWEFRFTVEGKKYWYNLQDKRASFDFPFKKLLHAYIKKARELSEKSKMKLRQPSGMHYLFDYHGDELYKKARTMARRVMEAWMERYFEDSDEEIEPFDATELLEYTSDQDDPHKQILDLMFACPFQFEELKSAMLQVEGKGDSDTEIESDEPDSHVSDSSFEDEKLDPQLVMDMTRNPKQLTKPRVSPSLLVPTVASNGKSARYTLDTSTLPRDQKSLESMKHLSEGSPKLEIQDKPITLQVPELNLEKTKADIATSKLEMLNLYKSSSIDSSKISNSIKRSSSKASSGKNSIDLGGESPERLAEPKKLTATDRILNSPSLSSLHSEEGGIVDLAKASSPFRKVGRTQTLPSIQLNIDTHKAEIEKILKASRPESPIQPAAKLDSSLKVILHKRDLSKVSISSSLLSADFPMPPRSESLNDVQMEAKLKQIRQERLDTLIANVLPEASEKFPSPRNIKRARSTYVFDNLEDRPENPVNHIKINRVRTFEEPKGNDSSPYRKKYGNSLSFTTIPENLNVMGRSMVELIREKTVSELVSPISQALVESRPSSYMSSPMRSSSFIDDIGEYADKPDFTTAADDHMEELARRQERSQEEQKDEGANEKGPTPRNRDNSWIMKPIVEESSPSVIGSHSQTPSPTRAIDEPMRNRYFSSHIESTLAPILDLQASPLMRSRMNSSTSQKTSSSKQSESSVPSNPGSFQGAALTNPQTSSPIITTQGVNVSTSPQTSLKIKEAGDPLSFIKSEGSAASADSSQQRSRKSFAKGAERTVIRINPARPSASQESNGTYMSELEVAQKHLEISKSQEALDKPREEGNSPHHEINRSKTKLPAIHKGRGYNSQSEAVLPRGIYIVHGKQAVQVRVKNFDLQIGDRKLIGVTRQERRRAKKRKNIAIYHYSAMQGVNFADYIEQIVNPTSERRRVNFANYLEQIANPSNDRKTLTLYECTKPVTPRDIYEMARWSRSDWRDI